ARPVTSASRSAVSARRSSHSVAMSVAMATILDVWVNGRLGRGSYRLPVVIVAFVLVLLAAVSFAVGIAASRTSDTLVYLSILFSIGAFVTLAIASFRARQADRAAPAEDWVAAPTPAPTPTRTIDETEAHAGPLLG